MDKLLTLVVNTRNAEPFLRDALASAAPVVDEIVVVDMMSTDRTLDIAREFGATIRQVPPIGYVEP